MTIFYQYDFFSLRNLNIQKWHDKFFWPIPWETTTRIATDLQKEHCRIIDELGYSFEGDCLLIGRHFSTLIIRVINHYVSLCRIHEEGFTVEYSDRLELIPQLLKVDSGIEFEHENVWGVIREKPLVSRIKNVIRSFRYNTSNGKYSFPDHFISNRCVFSFANTNITNRFFTKSLAKWIHFISPEEVLDGAKSEFVPCSNSSYIFRDISENYVNYGKDYIHDQFGVLLPEKIELALKSYCENYLIHIAHIYSAILKKIGKKCPQQLIAPAAGKSFIRALSLAVMNYGGEVTGFALGNDICSCSGLRRSFQLMSTVSKFVVYSPGSIPLFKRNLSMYPVPRNNVPEIINENSPYFLNIWNQWKNKDLPKNIETIMILELSLVPESAGYYRPDSMVNYHFYYSLCKILSENGYKVIFKRRTKDLSWDGIDIFKNIANVTIEFEHLTKPGIIDKADAVICHLSRSSTFNWLMSTNKTVIYVDAGWEPWFQDVYNLMAKRCRILHCWYDERNRQCFEKDELLEILKKRPEPPNTEFLEKYLFPTNDML